MLSAALAACCAVVLSARVYVDFERVRLQVVRTATFPSGGLIAIPLPDTSQLSGQPVAVVLRLENHSTAPRVVHVALAGRDLGRIPLAPSQQGRVDLSVSGDTTLRAGDSFELRSDGTGWALSYLELANVHGFSHGLFSLVIVPSSIDEYRSVSPVSVVVGFFVLLLLPIAVSHTVKTRALRIAHFAMAALVLGFFATILVASSVSQFAVLLSVPAFSICAGILYYPSVHRLGHMAIQGLSPVVKRGWSGVRRWPRLPHVAACALFLVSMAGFYDTDTGFTALIQFGDRFDKRALPAVRAVDRHVINDSGGYDGQFYAQLAVDPLLRDPAIGKALDSFPYRARRVLFSWTAFAFGIGQPRLILEAYVLQYLAFWLLLAVLLWRWFPPRGIRYFSVWFACMFSHGVLTSVTNALPDGASMLLLALAIAAIETGRSWTATALVGVSGLAKDVNLVWSAILIRSGGSKPYRSRIAVLAGQGMLVTAPLILWTLYVWLSSHEPTLGVGNRNFAVLTGYVTKWMATLAELGETGWWGSHARFSLLALVSLTTQALVLVTHRDWTSPWWRAGMASCILMLFLGPAVWHGHPGAVTRIVLPMTFAFNVGLQGTKWFWPLFVLGNLTIVPGLRDIHVPVLWTYL